VTLSPVPAAQTLDAYFLEARSKLLDLAAILDRIDRGVAADAATKDLRYSQLRQALTILHRHEPGRAEQVQQLFSLHYEPAWKRPAPR
jgi:hypothetical protein